MCVCVRVRVCVCEGARVCVCGWVSLSSLFNVSFFEEHVVLRDCADLCVHCVGVCVYESQTRPSVVMKSLALFSLFAS